MIVAVNVSVSPREVVDAGWSRTVRRRPSRTIATVASVATTTSDGRWNIDAEQTLVGAVGGGYYWWCRRVRRLTDHVFEPAGLHRSDLCFASFGRCDAVDRPKPWRSTVAWLETPVDPLTHSSSHACSRHFDYSAVILVLLLEDWQSHLLFAKCSSVF